MTTVARGQQAETAAATYLHAAGFSIIDRNWRRPYCEIDIVAERQRVIYFIEVKYRATANWGNGLDYISTDKLRRMRRAATSWNLARGYHGEYQLSAIAVSHGYQVTDFIASIYD